jgi:ABC-type polar amino acid transport system ATPase subunit
MTIICVAHEKGFARQIADGGVFMDAGAIVEGAPLAELFACRATSSLAAASHSPCADA